jgi:hypothetical protein
MGHGGGGGGGGGHGGGGGGGHGGGGHGGGGHGGGGGHHGGSGHGDHDGFTPTQSGPGVGVTSWHEVGGHLRQLFHKLRSAVSGRGSQH